MGSVQAVTYADPTVTGGASPVTTTCTKTSGSSFPLGTTSVSCTASDTQSRAATCSFNVTLTGFTIAVNRFEAIGDSLTEGENGRLAPSLAFVDLPNTYPTKLQEAFNAAYPGQGITVINRGHSGDPIETTRKGIAGYVQADNPGAVLLLTGYNDLFDGCGNGPVGADDCQDAIKAVAFGVRDCIREIKEAPGGIKYIFVSTLTPPGPVAPGSPKDRRISSDAITQANSRIRQVIGAEGATLVDAYPAFVGHEAEYTDSDGLHLRPAGYQALADAFFAAIQATVPRAPLANLR